MIPSISIENEARKLKIVESEGSSGSMESKKLKFFGFCINVRILGGLVKTIQFRTIRVQKYVLCELTLSKNM